jgi:putative hydrolase of the HAD superfamily
MAPEPTNRAGARRAVLLDALGTLLRFEPPAPRLRVALEHHLGVDVGAEAAAAAMRAEIATYRAGLHEAADSERLTALRRRCAEAMRPSLPAPASTAPTDVLLAALLDAIAFTAFPDALRALPVLRERGWRLVVVSNWDVSLHEQLARAGVTPLVDGAVASAEIGSAKPDPGIFATALEIAGAPAEGSWHVGDDVAADAVGALRSGLRGVLVDRDGTATGVPAGVTVISTLDELPGLLADASALL